MTCLAIIVAGLSISAFPQTKRANVWHFRYAALDFNIGSPPEPIPKFLMYNDGGTTSVSDTNGNLLFCCDGGRVLNKLGFIMQGGSDIGLEANINQHVLAFPMPGSERFYYLFTTSISGSGITGYQYSLIDMQANNGLGKVCDSVRKVQLQADVATGIHGIHHHNKRDIWIILHGNFDNSIYAYLITPDTILGPYTSFAGDTRHYLDNIFKLSPDGTKLAIKSSQPVGSSYEVKVQMLSFNDQTGEVSEADMFVIPLRNSTFGNDRSKGLEFSPDGSKFYVSDLHLLYQFDLKAGTPEQILASKYSYELDTIHNIPVLEYVNGILLSGPDGKIYINAGDGANPFTAGARLSVIHKPNLSGAASNFIQNDLYLGGNLSGFAFGLPNFLADWLKDPVIKSDKYCSNQPVNFSLEINGSIDSVFWDFNDFWNALNDTSTALSPSYTFSHAGTYNITAEIHFGNLQKTIPYSITILQSPEPQLGGTDTLMCQGSTIVLDPGVFVQYWWNGGMPSGQTYTVIDSGQYFVKVKNEFNCFGYDTINVHIPPPMVVVAEPAIQNATCGNPDGSITGIQLTGLQPFTYLWKNAVGDTVGDAQDLTGVVAGTYTLTVIDSAGCSALIGNYEINNTQGVKILDVSHLDDHCNISIGELTIVPDSGVPGDFEYSLDGTNFFSNNGVFTGLTADNYYPVIRDVNGCTDTWLEPVVIENIGGPVVLSINIEPETELGADGSITITADGNNLTYMITGGTPQAEPTFSGLFQGPYTITITDSFGCTTDTTITVPYVEGYYLHAVADNDDKCLHIKASSPVKVVNGAGMTDLKATLYYDGNIVDCIGFGYKMDGLDAIVYPASTSIVLDLQGGVPIPVSDSVDLIELIFDTYQAGFSEITWEDDNQQTWFKSEAGEEINAILYPGRITVHDPPQLKTTEDLSRCAGDSLVIDPALTGGTDPMQYTWHTPTGVIPGSRLTIPAIEETDAGAYILAVRDHFDCVDTSRFALTVIPAPETGFESMNDTIYFYKDYTLSAVEGYPTYEWNTGATTSSILVTDDGEYIVTVKTSENCENTGSIYMMNSDPGFFMPTAFTPNGDGLNDEFKAVIDRERIRQFHLAIYNKWGQLLFESIDAREGWNGGDAVPGVYIWKADFKDLRGEVRCEQGSVSLIR